MANPYKARVDVRRFLNLPGFHSGAYVVAYVEDTSERTPKKRDCFGDSDRYVNPQPRIILELADCANRINLELRCSLGPRTRLNQFDGEPYQRALAALIDRGPTKPRVVRARIP